MSALYVASAWVPLGVLLKKCLEISNRPVIELIVNNRIEYGVAELDDDEVAHKIEVLFADIPVIAKYRKKLVNLKWVHTIWNGVNTLMDSLDTDQPLPTFTLTKTPGSLNAPLITEFIIGHIIAKERLFFKAIETQRKYEWEQTEYFRCRSLSEVTIGILGVGEIGKVLAKVCKTFGMTVWGLTRSEHSIEDTCPYVDVNRTPERLDELLQNCDYICNILPSTPTTRNMLSGDILKSCMEKKSVFINVGRGDVIDEQSVSTAIKNGWLGGAVLDVHVVEPLPKTSLLWSLPGIIVTPHVSGWSGDKEQINRIVDCFLDNYKRFVEGRPLQYCLDWENGY